MKKDRLTNVTLILGVALVAAALGIFLFSLISQRLYARQARELVVQLQQLMPTPQNAAPDDRSNVTMASMEVAGENFCGILEIPAFNRDLPLCDVWSRAGVSRYPCRYFGSVYDRSIIIGGTDATGQLDFIRQITGGHKLYLTDMTGNRYGYTVSDVFRTKDVSSQYLTSLEGDLILFAKNANSLDYTVVIFQFG